jgi:plasmid stabilization system protein ParE
LVSEIVREALVSSKSMTKPERRKYVLGSSALLRLEAIWEYIATDSIEAADRWIAKLFDAFEAIARMRASCAGGRTLRITRVVSAG